MDWLIAGGFLGLIAYLSIFAWCAYYLFFRPMFNKDDKNFDVVERGVLLGILAGYFTHNFVVFDNIVSYIFFAVILALINSRVGVVPEKLTKLKVDKDLITQMVAPVVVVLLVAGIYFFHIPGIQAAGDIIDAFRSQSLEARIEAFETAVSRDSFAHQEITEQISQQAISLSQQQDVPEGLQQRYTQLAEEQIDRLLAEKPGDARVHVFAGSYYRATGQFDRAAEQMALAREYSPNKQAIIIQQAFVALSQGNPEQARDFLQTAFELDENNLEAREYYAGLLLYTDNVERALELMEAEGARERFARSDFLVSTASQFGHLEFATELFETRVNTEPDTRQTWRETPQTWATLAYLYYQQEDNDRAIEVLEESIAVVPSFASSATCFINSIEAGDDPQVACQ
jgi:tetratricopeptide (TPR) repeat protein